MFDMFQKCQVQHDRKLPFVLYRKPNANTVLALLQDDDALYKACNYVERGFVFAPFIGPDIVLIPKTPLPPVLPEATRNVNILETELS